MKKGILVLAFCLLGVSLFAQEKVAIIPFSGGEGRDGDTIARLLGTELTKLGDFEIVPRTTAINQVMEEHEFQRNGLTDSDTIAELGRGANANYVVSGHIQTLGNKKMISASIVDVETLQQLSGDYYEYEDISEIRSYLPTLAEKLVSNTKKDYSNVPTLAILPFDGVDENSADVLAQLLAIELANSGKYVVVTQTTTIENIMEEQNIQRSGLTDFSTASKLGAAINSDYVLVGTVSSLGSDNLMFVEIIDVQSLVQKDGAEGEYKTIEDGVRLMAKLSYELTGVKSDSKQVGIETELAVGFIETVLVKAGSFQMGSNDGGREEKPIHTVTLTTDYYMGKYEVTQGQWYEVMGTKPSYNAPASGWENLPVEDISWYDAVEFCNALSKKEGLEPYYRISGSVTIVDKKGKGYRLPTEAEWEYAASGGHGGESSFVYAGGNDLGRVGWYEDNNGDKTQEVGSKYPNDLGLYDMSGNVWEWCWDWYGDYSSENSTDPTGASRASRRIVRGGSYDDTASYCRVATRLVWTPSDSLYDGGFRVVRSSIETMVGEIAGMETKTNPVVVGFIETVLVEAGSFQMGSNDGDDDEQPVHKVTLTTDYYMGTYEVTQGQWYEVMGTKPSYNDPASGWENLPVEQVSWYEAIEFCNALSEQEGLEPYYSINSTNVTIANKNGKGYRLPTEAEWEYAARGYKYSGSNSIGGVAWYKDNSGGETQEVGSKRANGLGLYDMSGNVWEWCWDWYDDYSSGNRTDPTGASTGSDRVIRGGSYDFDAAYCRVAFRLADSNTPPAAATTSSVFVWCAHPSRSKTSLA